MYQSLFPDELEKGQRLIGPCLVKKTMSLKVQLLTSAQCIATLSEPWTIQWLSNKLTREYLRFREANLILSYCAILNKWLQLPEALRKYKRLLIWESKPHRYDLHPYSLQRTEATEIYTHHQLYRIRSVKRIQNWILLRKINNVYLQKVQRGLEGTSRKKKKKKPTKLYVEPQIPVKSKF